MYIFLQTTDLDASFKHYFIVVRPLFIAEMPFEAQTRKLFLQNMRSIKKAKKIFSENQSQKFVKNTFSRFISHLALKNDLRRIGTWLTRH